MASVSEVIEQAASALRNAADSISALASNGDTPSPATAEATGEKTGHRDRNGKPLRHGDYVQVFGSSRYGNPRGFIAGAADSHDSKDRVIVRLENGQNDEYTPSIGRVERVARFGGEGHPAS